VRRGHLGGIGGAACSGGGKRPGPRARWAPAGAVSGRAVMEVSVDGRKAAPLRWRRLAGRLVPRGGDARDLSPDGRPSPAAHQV